MSCGASPTHNRMAKVLVTVVEVVIILHHTVPCRYPGYILLLRPLVVVLENLVRVLGEMLVDDILPQRRRRLVQPGQHGSTNCVLPNLLVVRGRWAVAWVALICSLATGLIVPRFFGQNHCLKRNQHL
jgi:hypothetical protein